MLLEETERLLADSLARPGLVPVQAPGARDELDKIGRIVADAGALIAVAPRTWDAEILRLWSSGLLYLRDHGSVVAAQASLGARRLVLRASRIGPLCRLAGDLVLLDRTRLMGQDEVTGPVALVDCWIDPHVVVGPEVVAFASAFLPFSLARRRVRIVKSGVGSDSVLDGGAEFPPAVVPSGARQGPAGVIVSEDAWIGQQVLLTAGARIGRGSVVTAQTAVARTLPDFVIAASTPGRVASAASWGSCRGYRELPIDLTIRGLTAEEARREGNAQGIPAIGLPVYGPVSGSLTAPSLLECDYPAHGYLRDLTSINLLHFQRGALEAAMAFVFPEARVEVGFRVGKSVRFRIELDPAPIPPGAPGSPGSPGDRDRLWRALCNSSVLPPWRPT